MNSTRATPLLRAFVGALLVVTIAPSFVHAHHILGTPHYAYDEDYPQTPILTYRVNAGEYDVKMTGYPGKLEPGQRCSLHLYIHHKESGELLDVPVTMTVTQDRFLLEDPLVYGPMEARLDERIYKYHPHFEAEADYLITVRFEVDGAEWSIDLPLVVGEPKSPWMMLGAGAGGLMLMLLVGRAIAIKRSRTQRQRVLTPAQQ